MPWPSDTGTIPSNMGGTTLLADSSDDHGLMHREIGTILNALPTTLGSTSGTNLLRKVVNASDFLFVSNTGGTAATVITKGTFNNSVIGTQSATGGTLSAVTLSGQGTNSGTYSGGVYGTTTITGGTINSPVIGTPTIDVINARVSGTGVGFGNAIYPAEGTLVDSAGGTLTADARAAQIYYSVQGTAAGNRTLGTPTNPSNYQQLTYAFKTSGSANATIVVSSIFRISQDFGTPTLGTGVSWNYFNWRYNAIDSKWDFIGQMINLV